MGYINLRNSLFGYNKEDVYNYIKALNDKAEASKCELNDKIKELEAKVSEKSNELFVSEQKCNALCTENASLLAELEDFKNREAAITQLSESIGRLYIVAQANAKIISNSAKENAELVNSEADSHLDVVNSAHDELQEIKNDISDMTKRFIEEIERLSSELESTKQALSENKKLIKQAEINTEAMLSTVEK